MSPTFSSLNLVLLGPPGSGKGTQARLLAERYQLPHISTGDMLWHEVANGTGLGGEVQPSLGRGELVSDQVMGGLILQRIDREDCARGFILEGYPRKVAQAELLDGLLAELGRRIEHVILLDVPDDVIVARLEGRLTHPASGRVYHERYDAPRTAGVDDLTGETLHKRDDDQESVIRDRLRVYHAHADALTNHYRNRGQLTIVDANQPIDRVAEAVDEAIAAQVFV
jgi:adenylate kinase